MTDPGSHTSDDKVTSDYMTKKTMLISDMMHVAGQGGISAGQCRKWRIPVNTIAIPAASAAAITSLSRIDPPG